MFFIVEKTGNFKIQLVGNITFQSLSHEHDSYREAKALLSSVSCALFEVAGTVCDTQLDAPYTTPTNSCRICTSLNLIYLRPLWEQRSRPNPGSHAHIFTHTHRLTHIFHFIALSLSSNCTFAPVSLLLAAYLSFICSLFAYSILFHLCLLLSVLFHTQL